MTDNNKYENKTEDLIKKQEARKLTEEELEQVTGGTGRGTVVTGHIETGVIHVGEGASHLKLGIETTVRTFEGDR